MILSKKFVVSMVILLIIMLLSVIPYSNGHVYGLVLLCSSIIGMTIAGYIEIGRGNKNGN